MNAWLTARILAFLTIIGSVSMRTCIASACSPNRCAPASFVPSSGTVPANLPGAFWNPSEERGDFYQGEFEDRLRVVRIDSLGQHEIDFTLESVVGVQRFLVRFESELQPGASYRIIELGSCQGRATETMVDFVAGPLAVLPDPTTDRLGVINVGGERNVDRDVGTNDGSCTNEVSGVQRRLGLSLNKILRPWQDALSHSVNARRDGLVAEAFHICGGDTGGTVDGGAEPTIEWEATLPGISTPFTAPPVSIDLGCGAFSGCTVSNHEPTIALAFLLLMSVLRARRVAAASKVR